MLRGTTFYHVMWLLLLHSLVPRLPAFQCCTLKTGPRGAWCLKSHVLHHFLLQNSTRVTKTIIFHKPSKSSRNHRKCLPAWYSQQARAMRSNAKIFDIRLMTSNTNSWSVNLVIDGSGADVRVQ